MAAHQQTVGVDAVGCAGDQGAKILIRHKLYQLGVFRLHHIDGVHLIGEDLIHDVEGEGIAYLHFVQIAEELCRRKAAVAADDAVGTEGNLLKILLIEMRAADRKGGALNMPGRRLEDALLRAMVNRQVDIDAGDGDEAHIPRAAHVEAVIVDL